MKNILIVDDDADDREMFCEALEQTASDISCCTAPNGRRAIIALDNNELEPPHLIFLDINMPVMTGWQLLARLKERDDYKNIPVIMYSTSAYEEDIEKAQKLGALCFFTKPSNYGELKQMLASVVAHLHTDSLHMLALHSPQFLTSATHK